MPGPGDLQESTFLWPDLSHMMRESGFQNSAKQLEFVSASIKNASTERGLSARAKVIFEELRD